MRGFTCVPNEIFGEKALRPLDVLVFLTIKSFAYGRAKSPLHHLSCRPAVQTIADRCGLSARAVTNSIARLEAFGFLYRTRRGRGLTNIIYLVTSRAAFLRDREKRDAAFAREEEEKRRRELGKAGVALLRNELSRAEYRARLEEVGIESPLFQPNRGSW